MSISTTAQPLKQVLGIDIAKDDFKCQFANIQSSMELQFNGQRKFDNTAYGHSQLYKWIGKRLKPDIPFQVVMEATGVYHEGLAYFLHGKGIEVCLILPNRARHYLRSLGHNSKNDPIDARGLASMGCQQSIKVWQPMSPALYQLRQLTRQVEAFQSQRTIVLNQRHAISHSQSPVKEVVAGLNEMLKAIDQADAKLRQACLKLVKKDAKLSKAVELIETIKGMGSWTAIVIIAETDGFSIIESAKQLSSYAGYDVIENQSGKRSGKTKISKKGNAHLRKAMHFPAFCVVRHEEGDFHLFHQRLLDRGKTKMQAYVAVQRKLLVLAWVLCSKQQAFDPKYYLKEIESKAKKSRAPVADPAQDVQAQPALLEQ